MKHQSDFLRVCPVPLSDYPRVMLAHGGGGELMNQLIEKLFIPAFRNQMLQERHDGAVLEIGKARLAFTTDSYVVQPLFFPGGDIGALSVNGTVNDLAMCGARPLFISAGFILEEGFPMDTLIRIVHSMQGAARGAGVQLVTGDTKVVDKGKGDGVFINTAGIGVLEQGVSISPRRMRQGDSVILSGDIGRHGMAIVAEREGLSFESRIESDCAPLGGVVADLLAAGIDIRCMRDLTRGGLASALIEMAEAAGLSIMIEDNRIPIVEEVKGACEILGFDPRYIANEGRFVAVTSPGDAERALGIMRSHSVCSMADLVGVVSGGPSGMVALKSSIGTERVLDRLSGEQLPRIC